MDMLWPAILALPCCVLAIFFVERFSWRIGLIDAPGGHKHHDRTVPVAGGLAMALTILLIVPWFLGLGTMHIALYAGLALATAVGIGDDLFHLSARRRLLFQVVITFVAFVLVPEMRIVQLGDLVGLGNITLPGLAGVVFTLFACVGVMNAVNMIDGVDGLAGLFGLQAAMAFMVIGSAHAGVTILAAILAATILGFLLFNLRHPWRGRARVFMGDGGSILLGFALTWCAVASSQPAAAPVQPMVMVWLFGLPLLDTGYLIMARTLRGTSPMGADRRHFHHVLLAAGLTPGQTTVVWNAVAAAFIGIGVTAYWQGLPADALFYGFLVVTVIYVAAMSGVWRLQTKRWRKAAAEQAATD
ncbi:MraY family glycosyltransferase [Salinisphaera sp. P385]|uniref:MraY family glycosyltransferase n=1 Tax=Spectribacter acetivorans TaxID=3075603 RepID=A0ABU3BBM7_9GAMM|nr:MraY family glycosyltransferase [Salinisphaera sp. P385]MDT0619864.1 MraY family glycosyltransferase [Salinisphaera sp. P385]